MTDFSKKHRKKVAHFGLWAEETADFYGFLDALDVLKDAVRRTYEEEVRSDDLANALAYLERHGAAKRSIRAFREGLAIEHPVDRYYAVRAALYAIWRAMT